MALARLWAGRVYGTNTGNVFVTLDGPDNALTGSLRFNEPNIALVIYAINGTFDGTRLTFTGVPQNQVEGLSFGNLQAHAALDATGNLVGQWQTTIGSAGTFELFPHDRANAPSESREGPDQLYTARHTFGAIEIDREQITHLANDIQKDFLNAQVVVTVVTETEQSRYLSDFRNLTFNSDKASQVKIFAQQKDGSSTNKVVFIEFGPQLNAAMTQGADEAWILGKLEKLKRELRPLERAYSTNFRRYGFGVNQILLIGAITFLPSLIDLKSRIILMAGVLLLIYAVAWIHRKYFPLATIHLRTPRQGKFLKFRLSVLSWLVSVAAGVAATILAAYLQGWLAVP